MQMAAPTAPTYAMLSTISLRSYSQQTCHAHRSQPQEYRYLMVRTRAQIEDDNGLPFDEVNKQLPKKSSALSSAFERAAAYKKSLGKASLRGIPLTGKPSPGTKLPPSTDQKAGGAKNPSADQSKGLAEGKTYSEKDSNSELQEGVNLQDVLPNFNYLKSKQKSEMAAALAAKAQARETESGQEDTSQGMEVEIITRDGIIRRKVTRTGDAVSKPKLPKRTGITSSDFVGLSFSEKKSYGKGALPAGLAAGLEAPPPTSLPQVEIITRDGNSPQASKDSLYKPKVVTWGVFERPANISETYGGGRTIKPGQQLETEEEKNAREARTKELLAAYNRTIGLDVDPQIKADCTKALKQGNELFERRYIQLALEQFEKVMQQMPYQSELHGLAALQWALSLDSSNRFQEAKAMYEQLASHPNVVVRKKAKQLLYGFQAMDKLKVASLSKWDSTVYRKYFNAFSDGYASVYEPGEDVGATVKSMRSQAFVYLGLLVFPLALFLLILASKGR